MSKRMSEVRRSQELERLINEQSDDMASKCLFPESITPLRPTTLEGLTNKEKAVIVLSIMTTMSNVEIGDALSCNESSVRGYIKTGYRKLRIRFAK